MSKGYETALPASTQILLTRPDRLLCVGDELSARLLAQILSGDESHQPGVVRLNLSVLMSDEDAAFNQNALNDLAGR
jgi:hypothetical protein